MPIGEYKVRSYASPYGPSGSKSGGFCLPLLLLLLRLLREEDVGDGDVHLGDPQANQVLDLPYDVAAHGLGYPVDDPTVLDGHGQVHRRLDLAHLHRDALALACAADARYGAYDAPHGLRGASAHPDAFYLLSGDPCYLGDDAVPARGIAALSLQRASLLLFVAGSLLAHTPGSPRSWFGVVFEYVAARRASANTRRAATTLRTSLGPMDFRERLF